ncbi:LOW QUALITY PROTEIN: ATP-dependent DNA ligase clustered with Ku protein, LigD [Bacillus sp. JCM 19045]|nr:LOW QUALITY PROTEIN: ATP-dependent DNA ligase clustered with Ku protein, LigD [Bacillus sp. JCM 19045]
MLATAATDLPIGDQWIYEVKYDGYRCLLHWDKEGPRLFSRNEKELTAAFPEIIDACKQIETKLTNHLPLILDAEIVSLVNPYQSNFSIVQRRGKLRAQAQVKKYAQRLPVSLMVFDLLMEKGNALNAQTLTERKQLLHSLPIHTSSFKSYEHFRKENETLVKNQHGEGIIAKKQSSTYVTKRSPNWVKIKNYRYIHVIVTEYDKQNGYFQGSIFHNEELIPIVQFSNGLTGDDRAMLATLFKKNGTLDGKERWSLPPSICVSIGCISFDGEHLREPVFQTFLLDEKVEQCTWQSLHKQLYPLPAELEITSEEKPIWPAIHLTKIDFLQYLHSVAPVMLPFLTDRLLTTIRFPHGATGEAFYQKNCPDYAPSFIETHTQDEINYIVCNSVESLLWLGNQLALEFHLPYQKKDQARPSEIVFDLDPPDVNHFSLAIQAALAFKEVIDSFGLNAFIKTSGNKGLQLYLPLPEDEFTYQETRAFCQFISTYVVEQQPEHFTLERLKKNRKGRLYVDYLQHDEGKTIIAPYSPRGHERGLVATPLYWEEVTAQLDPSRFTLPHVLHRLKDEGDPFRTVRHGVQAQGIQFKQVLEHLKTFLKET